MGKISLELTTDASDLLNGTDEGIAGIKELAAQGRITKESLKKDFSDAGKSTKEFNTAIEGTVKSLAAEGKTIEALVLKYGSATAAQKAMQKELVNMAAAGKQGTKEFNDLRKATAELKDTIDDTRGSVKKLASDTSAFDKIAEGGRAVAAGFSVAAGASALFGAENEDLQKSIQKAQGAMTLLLGVQEIAKIATEEGGIATGFATAAQGAYSIVVGTSTGALKAFRLALAATGIGLIVIAVAALVANWDDLTEAIGLSNKELEEFAQIRKEAADGAASEAGKVGLLIERYKNVNTSQKERKQIIEELKAQSPSYFGTLDEEKTSVENLETAYKKYVQALILKATAEGLATKIAENNIKQITSQTGELTTFQEILAGVISVYSPAAAASFKAGAGVKNYTEEVGKAKEENEKLTKTLQDVISQMENLGGDPSEKAVKGVDKIRKAVSAVYLTAGQKVGAIFANEGIQQAILDAFRQFKLPQEEMVNILVDQLGLNPEQIAAFLEKVYAEKPIVLDKAPEVKFSPTAKSQNKQSLATLIFGDDEFADAKLQAIQTALNSALKIASDAVDIEIANNERLINSIQDRISAQENALSKQEDFQKRGLANSVATEKKRLAALHAQELDALEKHRKLAKEKAAIDAVTQAVSLITASANIFMSLSGAGPVGIGIAIGTIALMLGAFIAGQVKAQEAANSVGFREGGYTGDGDPSEVSTAVGNRGYKYHKKEFVANERMTAEGRDFLEAWHKGDKHGMLYSVADLLKDTGVVLPDENLPAKLFSARETHDRITSDENNSELKAIREKLENIEEELQDWKRKPKEDMMASGDKVIHKNGNRTIITTHR